MARRQAEFLQEADMVRVVTTEFTWSRNWLKET